ncbi:MEST-like protein, partial [Mya arenaria]
ILPFFCQLSSVDESGGGGMLRKYTVAAVTTTIHAMLDHDYLITEQADIHEALLTSLSIPRAHVMSHDYGDTVALELLHRLIKYITQRAENKDRWVGALMKTKLPVHMIYGPSDPVNSGYAFVDHYKKVVPSPSITVLDAAIGHYPQWEDPNAVFESYKSFLQLIKKT